MDEAVAREAERVTGYYLDPRRIVTERIGGMSDEELALIEAGDFLPGPGTDGERYETIIAALVTEVRRLRGECHKAVRVSRQNYIAYRQALGDDRIFPDSADDQAWSEWVQADEPAIRSLPRG